MTGPATLKLASCLALLTACLAGLHFIPDDPRGVWAFLGVMAGASLGFGGAAWLILRRGARPPAWMVVAISVGLHALLIPTGPHFDDDLYRYTWDGKVLAAGENPYAHPPNSLDLIELWRKDQYRIPYDHVSTIYPPATQLVFWGVSLVAPDSFTAMKLAFSGINIAALLALLRLLGQLGRPAALAALYGWNPLVLKEVADSGHMDPWMVLWLLIALSLLVARREALAVLAWTAAILCKLVPVALGFVLLRRLRRWWLLALAPPLLIAAYLPFMEPGAAVFGGLATYGRYWIFNPGAYQLIEGLVSILVGGSEDQLARLGRGAAGALALAAALLAARPVSRASPSEGLTAASLLTLGAILLLGPTVDPWYLLWIAPLVAIHPTLPGLVLTLAPLLSYAYYVDEADPALLRAVEYALIYGSLCWWLLQRRRGAPSLAAAGRAPAGERGAEERSEGTGAEVEPGAEEDPR